MDGVCRPGTFFGSAESVDQLAVLIDEETRRHMLIKQLIIDCQQMCVGQRRAGLPQKRGRSVGRRFARDRHAKRFKQSHISAFSENLPTFIENIDSCQGAGRFT